MGDRHKLALEYLSAPEDAKNEARRMLWGDCGSWLRFDKALEEVAKRGWANADGLTEAGKQRMAKYQIGEPARVVLPQVFETSAGNGRSVEVSITKVYEAPLCLIEPQLEVQPEASVEAKTMTSVPLCMTKPTDGAWIESGKALDAGECLSEFVYVDGEVVPIKPSRLRKPAKKPTRGRKRAK